MPYPDSGRVIQYKHPLREGEKRWILNHTIMRADEKSYSPAISSANILFSPGGQQILYIAILKYTYLLYY